jgi:hypothetical protein
MFFLSPGCLLMFFYSTNTPETNTGLFGHPPSPRSLNSTGSQLLSDLMAIEVRCKDRLSVCSQWTTNHQKLCIPADWRRP